MKPCVFDKQLLFSYYYYNYSVALMSPPGNGRKSLAFSRYYTMMPWNLVILTRFFTPQPFLIDPMSQFGIS